MNDQTSRRRLQIKWAILATALLGSIALGRAAEIPPKPLFPGIAPVCPCESLINVSLPNTTIDSAGIDPSNGWCRVIASVTRPFCATCTRARLSAEGQLYLCLFGVRAHDLKGLGATYEFPLITRIAASLCKLIDDKEKRMQASIQLIDAHIDAVKAAVRDNIKTDEHPVGKILITELERRVKETGA